MLRLPVGKTSWIVSKTFGQAETTPEKTAWTALNAMTERLDWHRQSRNGSYEGALVAASGFDPATNVEKNRLRKVTRSLGWPQVN